ncbi:carbohydrate porin [Endothiovibrio diazotrophicus]
MHHHRLKPLLTALLLTGPAAVPAAESGASFEGGVTAIFQDASGSRIRHDGTFSVDLVATLPAGRGVWTVYLEGGNAPADDGPAALLGEANGDAGSALDSSGNGRLQLSELHYALPLGDGTLTAGLMDTSAFLDTNGVANDETAQFLNANLVNNPTIGFPDYTLGVAWQGTLGGGPGFTLVAARSHGLGDDYASYSSLFDNDIEDVDGDGQPDDKGLFLAGELAWAVGETALQAGLWANTSDHAHLDGSAGTDNNAWGLYGLAEGPIGGHLKWNLRAGWAAPKLSEANAFLSGALEIPTELATVGVGAGRTWVSDDLAGGKDTSVAELYGRFALTEQFAVTPSVQWIGNSNFDGSGTVHDDDEWVISVRAQLDF